MGRIIIILLAIFVILTIIRRFARLSQKSKLKNQNQNQTQNKVKSADQNNKHNSGDDDIIDAKFEEIK